MKTPTPTPTAAEIERLLAERTGPLQARTQYAQYAQPATAAIRYLDIVNGRSDAVPDASRHPAALTQDLLAFLRSIATQASFGLKAHYQSLGWSVTKGNARLAQLKTAGLIVITQHASNSPLGGRSRLVPSLTPLGQQTLKIHENHTFPI